MSAALHFKPCIAQVNVVEFNASTSFEEQLRTMAATGVFVSVHTSNLANAPFLQPGSAVIEIIQRNWIWDNLDRSFQVTAWLACTPQTFVDSGFSKFARNACAWLPKSKAAVPVRPWQTRAFILSAQNNSIKTSCWFRHSAS